MGGSPIAGWFYVYFMENPARKWVRLGTNYRKPDFILGNRSTPKSSCGDLGILHIFIGVYRKSYFGKPHDLHGKNPWVSSEPFPTKTNPMIFR